MFFSEKCALGGYDFTSKSPRSLDRTLLDLFRLTREKSRYTIELSNFEYLYSFQRYLPPSFEVDRNRAKFCMFLTPEIFLGCASLKHLDGIIKVSLVLTTVQNFTPVGLRISEISRGKKNKTKNLGQSPT